MSTSSVSLGRVAGIPVGVHYSWLIIATLISFSLASRFRLIHPDWQTQTIWLVAVLTAMLFFVSLLVHEMTHALVARAYGLPVRSITLFALGGVATIEEEATSPKAEFLIAVVGPLISLVIGVACIVAAQSLGSLDAATAGIVGSVLGWLGSINIILAVFNLIPGYPLDGGRLLRALLWRIYNDVHRATRNAARVGQVVAALFIAWGVLQFFGGAGIGGIATVMGVMLVEANFSPRYASPSDSAAMGTPRSARTGGTGVGEPSNQRSMRVSRSDAS